MFRGLKLLAVVAALLFCLTLGISWVAAQEKPDSTSDDDWKRLARDQKEAKEELQRLEEMMQKVAKKIEEKQPDEAKKLMEAWKAAREKLLVEDMEAIQKSLSEGRPFPAYKAADKVVQNLVELLNYLIGKRFERKNLPDELEELKKNIEKINELERKQKDLIEKTDDISRVKDRIKSIEQAMKEIDRIAKQQADLQKNPSREGKDSDSQITSRMPQRRSKVL
jgi:DNA repair exonuclease SbcCD ATPase subunit